jgi:hypothetical protein
MLAMPRAMLFIGIIAMHLTAHKPTLHLNSFTQLPIFRHKKRAPKGGPSKIAVLA